MRTTWLISLTLCGLAFGQAPAPAPAPPAGANTPAAAATPAPTTKPEEPVITIKTPCEDPAKKDEMCETVVTRDQFEKLAEALQPGMSPPIKIRLANALANLTAMSKEAEKRGLDKQPRFQENMRFARMQILSQQLTASLQQDSQNVPDAEIEKYYNDNKTNYDEANLLRLYVPVNKQVEAKATPVKAAVKKSPADEKAETDAHEKAGKAAMQKTAELLRARAAKGESFDVLAKEAFLAAGLKGNPPSTKMEKVRANTLPPTHKVAFSLKPGEVTPVISDPSGNYVYKMVSKQTLPLDAVKAEIKNWIASQHFRDAMQQYRGTSQLNEAYFGVPPKPKPVPGKPGSQPEEESVDPD